MPKQKLDKIIKSKTRKVCLTEKLLKEIEKYCKVGLYDKTIYGQLGIPRSTWYYWKTKAENISAELSSKKKVEFPTLKKKHEADLLLNFMDIVKKGRHQAIARNVLIIQAAAVKTWQAAAWYLERMEPNIYGRTIKQNIDMTVKKHSPIDEMLNAAKKAKELGYVPTDIIASNN